MKIIEPVSIHIQEFNRLEKSSRKGTAETPLGVPISWFSYSQIVYDSLVSVPRAKEINKKKKQQLTVIYV